jgi:putative oxidoreductase
MSCWTLSSLDRYRDQGLLILRIGLGVMFILHGWPKLAGGPELWKMVGGATANFGIHFAPEFWGFLAACAEFFGGVLLILGLFTRLILFPLVFDMLVALSFHLYRGDNFGIFSHPLEVGIVFASLILIGPGRFSLDYRLFYPRQ